jgi:hypothetical protein
VNEVTWVSVAVGVESVRVMCKMGGQDVAPLAV